MKIAIVDDEPLARERLRRMIETFPGYAVVGEAGDGDSALQCVRDQGAETVLLDIHMPGVDGLQTARRLAALDVPPAVIFVTAHSEHALSAHNGHAAGYLLKPVRRDDLAAALARASRPTRAQISGLETYGTGRGDRRAYITARTRDGLVRVAVRDILYFWADQKYTTVYHVQGELLIEQSLAALEESLEDRFLRVHRKALVARHHVIGLRLTDPEGATVVLRHVDARVPVSRRRLAEVRALLEE